MFYEPEHMGTHDYFKIDNYTDLSFPLHLHQCFELIYVEHGQMTVTVDRHPFNLTAGQSILIYPHQVHSLACDRSRVTILIFSPLFTPDLPTDVLPLLPLFPIEKNRIEQLKSTKQPTRQKGLLYLIYADMEQQTSFSSRSSRQTNLLERIFLYVDSHYADACSLADTAKALGYDPCYLSRYFKKQVGYSFSEYLTAYRLSRACYLLKTTERTILDCAMSAGFTGLRNFNLCFRKQYSLSPSAYRKASR
jgi:AraC-like DNA-binding protein